MHASSFNAFTPHLGLQQSVKTTTDNCTATVMNQIRLTNGTATFAPASHSNAPLHGPASFESLDNLQPELGHRVVWHIFVCSGHPCHYCAVFGYCYTQPRCLPHIVWAESSTYTSTPMRSITVRYKKSMQKKRIGHTEQLDFARPLFGSRAFKRHLVLGQLRASLDPSGVN
jgi:hypothetical protein